MKLDDEFRLQSSGEIATINGLVGRDGLTVTGQSPYRVRYIVAGEDGFYQWSVSKYAAQSLISKGVPVETGS